MGRRSSSGANLNTSFGMPSGPGAFRLARRLAQSFSAAKERMEGRGIVSATPIGVVRDMGSVAHGEENGYWSSPAGGEASRGAKWVSTAAKISGPYDVVCPREGSPW